MKGLQYNKNNLYIQNLYIINGSPGSSQKKHLVPTKQTKVFRAYLPVRVISIKGSQIAPDAFLSVLSSNTDMVTSIWQNSKILPSLGTWLYISH